MIQGIYRNCCSDLSRFAKLSNLRNNAFGNMIFRCLYSSSIALSVFERARERERETERGRKHTVLVSTALRNLRKAGSLPRQLLNWTLFVLINSWPRPFVHPFVRPFVRSFIQLFRRPFELFYTCYANLWTRVTESLLP